MGDDIKTTLQILTTDRLKGIGSQFMPKRDRSFHVIPETQSFNLHLNRDRRIR